MRVLRFFQVFSMLCAVALFTSTPVQAKWFFLNSGKKKEETVSDKKRITAMPIFKSFKKKRKRRPKRVQISPVFRKSNSADPLYLELLSQARMLDPMLLEVDGPAPTTQDELRQMIAVKMMDKVAHFSQRRDDNQKRVGKQLIALQKQHAKIEAKIERNARMRADRPVQENIIKPRTSSNVDTHQTRKKPPKVFRSY